MSKAPIFRHGVQHLGKEEDESPDGHQSTRVDFGTNHATVSVWQFERTGTLIKMPADLPFYVEVGIYWDRLTDEQRDSLNKVLPEVYVEEDGD